MKFTIIRYRLTWWMARRFGKKFVGTDVVKGSTVTTCYGYYWRGQTYIEECKTREIGS